MADYEVMVQNEEGNESNVSVTGMVNGVQVAAVVRRATLPKGAAARSQALANALVDAYEKRPKAKPSAAAIKVSRP